METLNDDILQNFLAGKCTEEELVHIHTWMSASPENAERLFRLEEVYHLGQFDQYQDPARLSKAESRLFQTIRREEQKKAQRKQIRRWMNYAAMTTILLLIGGGIFIFQQSDLTQHTLIATADAGTIKEIILPDGSKVWLNNGATLKYPQTFSETERKVYLDGEAYFEVAKNRKKPFIAESEAMRVRVLGTHFNLKSNRNSPVAEATLIEGEIEVKGNNDEGMIILNPGQRAELSRTSGRMIVKQVDAKLDAVWHDSLIPFEKANIFDIAKTLERFYGVKIILSPDIATDRTYSGVLKRKETIDSVLSSLQNSIPIKYRITEKNIFISAQQH